jgi:FtsP/CotA-like multicopper oxidase with cupredoxin domain
MRHHSRDGSDDIEAAQLLLNGDRDEADESTVVASSSGDGTPTPEASLKKFLPHDFVLQPKRTCFSVKLLLSLLILMSFSVLSLSAAYSAFKSRSGKISSTVEAAQEEHARDGYVLDPSWDFNAASQERHYHWTITDKELNPDGVYRPMVVINGQFPGPLVEVNEGDTIIVHVNNQGINATAFHWHGIYQNGSNAMDGTVGVTQCPIAPGTSFTYKFQIKGQSGTYWYHSHMTAQASDGLYGPLIIHSKDERKLQKPQYSTDQILMVSDHYYDLSGALMFQYLRPDRENAEPVPAAALINGQGIRNCDHLPNRKCDNSTAGVGVPKLNLEAGQNHRIRFINTGAFAEFQIQFDEHEFAVTEADGTDIVPKYYHRLNILPAQRYSVVITTNRTDQWSYWLRARTASRSAIPNWLLRTGQSSAIPMELLP